MLEGELMPRRTLILADLVAVTFIGKGSLPKSKLKSLFRVRRKIVHAVLIELKHVTKHPGYINLEVNQQALEDLPDDAVPEEILTTIRREEDEATIVRESAGYVPQDLVDGVCALTFVFMSIGFTKGVRRWEQQTGSDNNRNGRY
jgi:hypothetical protein